jgi:hypothetical protein
VVAVINDAASSLERFGLARTISDARTRAGTEQFREALIGSVSHELRAPLASIMDASTVLSAAPEVASNARLESLAVVIHHESERLNAEIQNILDASRISRDGLQVKLEWSEPADFVNAALERCRHRLAKHKVEVSMPNELVLLHVDSVLMERALGLILENAAKYSLERSVITLEGRRDADAFVLFGDRPGRGPRSQRPLAARPEVLPWQTLGPIDLAPGARVLDCKCVRGCQSRNHRGCERRRQSWHGRKNSLAGGKSGGLSHNPELSVCEHRGLSGNGAGACEVVPAPRRPLRIRLSPSRAFGQHRSALARRNPHDWSSRATARRVILGRGSGLG